MKNKTSKLLKIVRRFLRHLNLLTIDRFDDAILRRIFTTEADWHFKVRSHKFVGYTIYLIDRLIFIFK